MHAMEKKETNEKDKSQAGNYHSAQREAVAACSLNYLRKRQ